MAEFPVVWGWEVGKTLIRGLAMCAVLSWVTTASGQAELIYGVTSTNLLLSFDSATPGTAASVSITGLQAGESILGIDLRPATGGLYALGSTSRLYTINPTTGAATAVDGPFAPLLNGTSFGFDFNPTVDRIRVVSDADQNLRLNPDTGLVAGVDTNLAYATGDVNFGANPNDVAAAYTNNVGGATTTTLFGIDSNLDILVRQGGAAGAPPSPNTGQLVTIGPLGVNAADAAGFDISGVTGTAYASLTPPTGAPSALYTMNLGSGAATLVGTIGTGFIVVDIAVGVQGPTPTPTATLTATVTTTPTPTSSPTVTSTPLGGGAPAEIPTLSGWGLAAMVLLLAALGYFVVRSGSSGS